MRLGPLMGRLLALKRPASIEEDVIFPSSLMPHFGGALVALTGDVRCSDKFRRSKETWCKGIDWCIP